jgi:hypothetical protein
MERNLTEFARQFMQDQLAIMRKYGSEPKLDKDRREAFLRGAQRAFKGISSKHPSSRKRHQAAAQ